ncbi:MAG: glycosyltransferase [Bacteroidales bacterium]|nr:glycosyltransferase [Bacteroidales bacterium]
MSKQQPTIWIALPVMNEIDWLPHTLRAIENQSYKKHHLVICVNQPDSYRYSTNTDTYNIFANNQKTLSYLRNYNKIPLTILDRSSEGNGWESGKGSVGQARKTIMDFIADKAADEDIMLSLDADTTFESNYFNSVVDIYYRYPLIHGLSNPYLHHLTKDKQTDYAILRYEIYMRNYSINQFRIHSPYRFTALGSAIATKVSSYKRIGGMTPKKSGEDFYFLQKLLKSGPLCLYNSEFVYPAARFSNRVFFGTGPAMIKGNQGNWDSYPIYSYQLFDKIKQTQEAFRELYNHSTSTPMDDLLHPDKNNLWKKLRRNAKSGEQFIKACHQKVDGLRILQFLKANQHKIKQHETQVLLDNMRIQEVDIPEKITHELNEHSVLTNVSTESLITIRGLLLHKEIDFLQKHPLTSL